MKRVISIFMLVCLLAGLFTVSAFADNEVTSQTEFVDAVKGAPSGSTITLGEGTFNMVDMSGNNKTLTIVGVGENTIIDFTDTDGEMYLGMITYDNVKKVNAGDNGGENEEAGGEDEEVGEVGGNVGGGFSSVKPMGADITNADSLQNAINAGGTVKLDSNIELADRTITVPDTATVILDLNGNTISGEMEQDAAHSLIENKGSLTIMDSGEGGKITYKDTGSGSMGYVSNTITNYGSFTLLSGTIENTSSSNVAKNGVPNTIDNNSTTSSVSCTIKGGAVTNVEYTAIRQFCNSTRYTNTLTITGGTITGRVDLQNPGTSATLGTLNISGGTFNPTKYNGSDRSVYIFTADAASDCSNLDVNISGGTFKGIVMVKDILENNKTLDKKFISGGTFANDVSEFAAPGFVAKQNSNGTYTVEKPANPYGVPSTADNSNMPLWGVLLVGFAAVALLTGKKKKA